jgi:uncharacterized protein (TIGR03032 family)
MSESDSAKITDEGQNQTVPEPPKPEPVVCKSTKTFSELLHKLGITALISTYQAGHVIAARAQSERELNLVFRRLPSPMGMALGRKHLAIGTKQHIWEYRNNASVSKRLEPADKHDVVFMPSNCKVTGDVRIHEMAYIGNELWFVNTRFSCLSIWSHEDSFIPRWRPPFITQYAAEDRCHLNGIGIRDGKIAYASALGTTDTPQGWRDNKTSGGVVMEVPSGKIVIDGLSMPHSPRWYRDRLWILDSGKGHLSYQDGDGTLKVVAELPGFTRGLAFVGPYAFIGLSKVRETNVFGGIQLNERVSEKQCGVAVVDIRNGKTIAMLRFESGVAEIFDIQLIRAKWPELVDTNSDLIASSFVVPNEALSDMKLTIDRHPDQIKDAADKATKTEATQPAA